ncbi:MAG: hypothetical protein LC679_17965 [Intrasporangiaceae bacterium]|nr:hypothetical protein [Intrasporangiaceae bacterium]
MEIVGDPVLTTSGAGWSVRISPGEDDRWCVTAVRDTTEPWGRAGEPCWQIEVPAGVEHDEPVAVLGRATDLGDRLLVGSADRAADRGVEVTLVDGSKRDAVSATGGRLPFRVWFVPLDGPIPMSVEVFSSTGSLGSVDVPALAPPEMVESISDTEMQDLQALADQKGISLDTAIVHYAWRDDFSFAVQEIQQTYPEVYAGAEIGGLDDVWVAFTGPAPAGVLDIVDEFNHRFENLGMTVEVRADGAVTEAQLTEAIKRVHRGVLGAPEVADASTTYDRQAGQITTRVVLEDGAPSTAIEDLQDVAEKSLMDAVGKDVAEEVTVSVQRSYLPLGDDDSSG